MIHRKLAYTATPKPWRSFRTATPGDLGTWPSTQPMTPPNNPLAGGRPGEVWGNGTPSDVGPYKTFPFPQEPFTTNVPVGPKVNISNKSSTHYSTELKEMSNSNKDKMIEYIMTGNWDSLTTDEKLTVLYNQMKIQSNNTNNLLLGVLIFLVLIVLKLYSN